MTWHGVSEASIVMGAVFWFVLLAACIGWGVAVLLMDGEFEHKIEYVLFPLSIIFLLMSMFMLAAVSAS